MNREPIKKIAILGGGLVGWMAAAILARGLKAEGVELTLIDIPDMPADDLAESSLPAIRQLHQMLGFDERQLMSITGASFKLGTEYQWGQATSFVHPMGKPATIVPALEQEVSRLHLIGDDCAYENYFLSAVAARQGKFAFPDPDEKSIRSTLSCGLHLDVKNYKEYLKDYARFLKVAVRKGALQAINICSSSGFIKALVLDDNSRVEADLYVDCSGESALLIGSAELAVPYASWQVDLPLDRMVNFSVLRPSCKTNTICPLTKVRAAPWGWQREIPLQRKVVHQFIYHSGLLDDEGLAKEVHRMAGASDVRYTSREIKPGCREVLWSRNCVAVGAAAGNITSLAVSELHWAQSALVRLLDYFPNKSCEPFNAAEYNRLTMQEFERLRDFHIAHQVTMHSDSAFARLCSEAPIPAPLQHRIDLFLHRGRIAAYEYEVMSDQLWAAFFLGAGLWPKRYDIMTEALPERELLQNHQRIRAAISKAANAMPNHHELLASYCPTR